VTGDTGVTVGGAHKRSTTVGDTAASKHAATVLQFVRSPTGDAIAGSSTLSPVIGG
jgi:hypothetical protein